MANKKNKEINHNNLVTIKSITDNQKVVFDSWKKGKNQFLFGAAGTGKTFISLYLALRDVMDLKTSMIRLFWFDHLFLLERLGFCRAMRKIRAYCIKCHIRTWCSLCLKCKMNNNLIIYMID